MWNTPNKITAVRILASLFVFVALQFNWYTVALVLFILAAGTDWLDGYLARKYDLVTQLGRVLDPLADKIIICGTFIFLAAQSGSQIAAWMAVVVVARELVVTVVRSFLEQHGKDFSASMPGKVKFVLQAVAVALSILLLRNGGPDALSHAVLVAAYLATAATVYSGFVYFFPAAKLFREIG